MTAQLLLILVIFFAALIFFFFLIKKTLSDLLEKQKPAEDLLTVIKMLTQTSKEDRKTLLDSLQRNTEAMNQRLDKAAQIIGSVQKNIGEFSEIGRGMKELQEFLRSPKLRGNIGEHILKELLSQMLPKNAFFLQYKFKNGSVVDAAIHSTNGLIPIDSKFPLEAFRKLNTGDHELARKQFVNDVKKHIKDIADKYILPDEGTIDYALMYIPSESVYYEIVNNPSLFEYAAELKVLPVSPTTFYAYIKAILMSFEGQKITEQTKKILSTIKSIQKNYSQTENLLSLLGKHMTNASNAYNSVWLNFGKLGQKIEASQDLEISEKESQLRLEEKN